MKRSSILLLQALIIFISISAFSFLLLAPHFEGRNTNATLSDIYFKDPFLAFVYAASVPFFIILYNTFTILRDLGADPRPTSTQALKTIQTCSVASIAFTLIGAVWLLKSESDDKPPIIMIGTVFVLIFFSAYVAAGKIRSRVQKKSI